MPVLDVQNAKKAFGDNEVLHDISFHVDQGEVVAIIGPSGSGKSTLLRCCTTLETLDGGSIYFGADVYKRQHRLRPLSADAVFWS